MIPLFVLINLFKSKKAQLGPIEAKFFLFGVIGGLIIGIVLVYLANNGILIPFKLSFLCPVVKAGR